MALVERTKYCLREVPSSSARLFRCSFLHIPSRSRLSLFRLRHAIIYAQVGDKEGTGNAETEAPQPGHRCLQLPSRRASRSPKVSNVQNQSHLDEQADKKFMREALCEARQAAASGEVPVGAVLVSQGKVIARAHNRVERENDPTAHAEMICIRQAARNLGGWRLPDSILYVTIEPCPMCAGAILQSRVNTLVWGAQNTLLGADGSWISLFPRQSPAGQDGNELNDSKPNVLGQDRDPIHPFNPTIKVRGGILASDCSEIMKRFFHQRRNEAKKAKARAPTYSLLSRLILAFQKVLYVALSFIQHLGFKQSWLQIQPSWRHRYD